MIVREAREGDEALVAEIYGHHVLTGLGTFEETPPSAAEMAGRIAAIQAFGLPYLVAEAEGSAIGFASASPFRPRVGYRYAAEDSVYVSAGRQGQGVGRLLLETLIARCEGLGLRQLIAVIGDSGNTGSIALHGALGFTRTGLLPSVGFKQGRWVDVVCMQRALNDGDATIPSVAGLSLAGGSGRLQATEAPISRPTP